MVLKSLKCILNLQNPSQRVCGSALFFSLLNDLTVSPAVNDLTDWNLAALSGTHLPYIVKKMEGDLIAKWSSGPISSSPQTQYRLVLVLWSSFDSQQKQKNQNKSNDAGSELMPLCFI